MTAPTLEVTREFAGHGRDGKPFYSTTFHSHAKPPENLAEWVAIKVTGLGGIGTWGAGRVVAQLLEASTAKAVNAAAEAGGALDPWQRHGVLQVLQLMRGSAGGEFPAAVPHLDALIKAWTAKHGAKEPPRLRPVGFDHGETRW